MSFLQTLTKGAFKKPLPPTERERFDEPSGKAKGGGGGGSFGVEPTFSQRAPERHVDLKEPTGFLASLGRFILPKSLEERLGLSFPDQDIGTAIRESEDIRLSISRQNQFKRILEEEKVPDTPVLREDYIEPTGFFDSLIEGGKLGVEDMKSYVGYFSESMGITIGSPLLVEWGEEFGDRQTAKLLNKPELFRPDDLPSFLEGGYKDPRYYGRVIGETIPAIIAMLTAGTVGGIIAGPSGAAIGARSSIFALEQSSSYKSMINKGVPPDKAVPASQLYGAIATVLEEKLGYIPSKITGKFLKFNAIQTVSTNYKKWLLVELPKIIFRIGKKSIEEGVEEVGQKTTENLITKYFVENQSVWEDVQESFIQGTIGSLPFGVSVIAGADVLPPQVPFGLSIKPVTKITAFHKTVPENIESIKETGLRPGPNGIWGNVGFLATSKKLVTKHIPQGEFVELEVDLKNPLILRGDKSPIELLKETKYKTFEEWAKSEGYDGVIIKAGGQQEGDVILTLDAESTRPAKTILQKQPTTPEEAFELFDIKLTDDTKIIAKKIKKANVEQVEAITTKVTQSLKEQEVIIQEQIIAEEKNQLAMSRPRLYKAIKTLGGIKSYKGGFLGEEISTIPLTLRNNKLGITLEEMVDDLNHIMGFNFSDDNDLFTAITDLGAMPARRQRARGLNIRLKTVRKKQIDWAKKAEQIVKKATIRGVSERKKLGLERARVAPEKVARTKKQLLEIRLKEQAIGAKRAIKAGKKVGKKVGAFKTKRAFQKKLDKLSVQIKSKKLSLKAKRILARKYVIANLPPSLRGKYLARLTGPLGSKTFGKLFTDVKADVEKHQTNKLARLIKAELRNLSKQIKTELRSKSLRGITKTGKPKGKFTPVIQKQLNLIRALISLPVAEQTSLLSEILAKINRGESITIIEKIEFAVLTALANNDVVSLSKLLNDIRVLKEKGRMQGLLKDLNKQAELQLRKDELVLRMRGGKEVTGRETTGIPHKGKFRQLRDSLLTLGKKYVLSFPDLLSVLDFYMPVSKQGLRKQHTTLQQENTYRDLKFDFVEDLAGAIIESYGIKRGNWQNFKINRVINDLKKVVDLGTFKNADDVTVELKMTKDELIKRYMEFQDPTLFRSFVEGNKYTREIVIAIKKALTTADKLFAINQLGMYQALYDKVNAVYKEIYNIDLPFNKFYSPIAREGFNIEEAKGVAEFVQEIQHRRAITSGSFITRKKVHLPLRKQGSLQVLNRHFTMMNHFVAWAEKIRELDTIFSDQEVRNTMVEQFNDNLLKQIDTHLDDFKTQGKRKRKLDKTVDFFRTHHAVGALMLKPVIGIKQLVSTLAYLDTLSHAQLAAGVIDFWKHPVKNYRILNQESSLIRTRGKNIERDLHDALNSREYSMFSNAQSLMNISMLAVKIGDKGAIVMGAWAMRKAGFDVAQYEEFSADTQQSSDLSRMSIIQKGNAFAKLFTVFKSSPRAYLAKEFNAIRSLFQTGGLGKKNVFKVAKTLWIYHILLPVVFQAVANAGRTDEEAIKDYKRAAIVGPINGLFFLGDIIYSFVGAILGMQVWGNEVSIQELGDDLISAIQKVKVDDVSAEDVQEAMSKLVDSGNSFAIPVKQTKGLYRGIADLIHGNVQQGILQVLGWTPWALGIKGGKKKDDAVPASVQKLLDKLEKSNKKAKVPPGVQKLLDKLK